MNKSDEEIGGDVKEPAAFTPKWPDGLESDVFYTLPCDDKGRYGGSWLKVLIAQDGDVHLSMQDWEDIRTEGSAPDPMPTIRCRTLAGGGRNQRVHQALLWLARAIQLDAADAAGAHGDARCGFCDGPMPCYCEGGVSNTVMDADAEARNRVDTRSELDAAGGERE